MLKKQVEPTKLFNAASPLTNFEIQMYYQNEPKYNGVYSRNKLPEINDGGICNIPS